MFKNILLATDGSAASAHAAKLALDLAHIHGAKLTAVYVVDPYPYLSVGQVNPLAFQAYMSAAYQHAAQVHSEIAALGAQSQPPMTVQLRRIEDMHASDGILQTAAEEGADLIVMGSHGRTGISRLMLGSITAKVVARATIPVLLARAEADESTHAKATDAR